MYRSTFYKLAVVLVILASTAKWSQAQYCDSLVPTFNVDLSASPIMNWTSPSIVRDGNCCGTTAPDNCLEFVITLHPQAIAVNFNIASGAIPPGALFYQINCGPPTPVGSPICISGPGPHVLTFCKPGNNNNTFSVVSYSAPIIGPDLTLNAACQGFIYAQYYDESSITWNSIAPGAPGTYNGLLSCTAACDTTYITAPVNAPAFVDYLVCGMDAGGCDPNPICDTIRVFFIPPVNVVLSAPVTNLCPGETTTLTATVSGGSGAYTFNWSNGFSGSSQVLGAGSYSVDVQDSSGCFVATDQLTLVALPAPPVNAGPDQVVCEGTAVTLAASGAVNYVWDNGVLDGQAFTPVVGAVTYTVVGTDNNGCTANDQVVVTVNPLPVVNAGNDVSVCEGISVSLSGSGAVNYSWTGGVVDGQAFTPALGTSNYTVTGTDANGCVDTDDVTVVVNPLPFVEAGMDQVLCQGESATLIGMGPSFLSWSGGVQNNTPFQPPVGTSSYTLTGVDNNGCQSTDAVNITVNPLPVVEAGPNQSVCEGVSVIFDASGASSYVWSNGAANGSTIVLGVGTWSFSVVGTDENGCSNEDGLQITVNPNPELEAGADIALCEGELYTLSAVSNGAISWNSGQANGSVFTPDIGATEYIASASSSFGCISLDSLVVTVYPNPIVVAEDVEICLGEVAVLNAQGADTYVWTGGIQNGQGFYPQSTQSYMVTGTDVNGCTATATATVTVHDLPYVNFTILDPSLTTMESTTGFDNLSQGATSYFWDFGDGTFGSTAFEPEHTFPDESGEYTITLTGYSEHGCPAEKIKYVHVFPDFTVYVPNTFTPDQNGQNEVFKPVLDGFDPQDYTLYIFNRWGDLIFESHDMEVGWDGTFAGQNFQVQDNVYVWKIIAGLENSSDTKIFVGHVALLK